MPGDSAIEPFPPARLPSSAGFLMLEMITTAMTTSVCQNASPDHPATIQVTYRPAPPSKPGGHTSKYIVSTAAGETLCTARTPFYSAARALLARGHNPLAVLYLTPEGSPNWSLRGQIGKAAKLTVRESETVGPIVVRYDGDRLAELKSCRPKAE